MQRIQHSKERSNSFLRAFIVLVMLILFSFSFAISGSVYHVASYSLQSVGSKPPKYVMIRFDDSLEDQWVNALPILQHYNFKAVFLAVTGVIRNGSVTLNSGYENLNWTQVKWLYSNGNEIADHTSTHPDLNHQSNASLWYELGYSKQVLAKHNITNVPDFVPPYGDAMRNQTIISYAYSPAGYAHVFGSYEGQPGITNYSGYQSTWFPIDNADRDTSLRAFESFANRSSSSFIPGFEFHHVNDHMCCGEQYYVNTTSFARDMAWLNASGFTIVLPIDLPNYTGANSSCNISSVSQTSNSTITSSSSINSTASSTNFSLTSTTTSISSTSTNDSSTQSTQSSTSISDCTTRSTTSSSSTTLSTPSSTTSESSFSTSLSYIAPSESTATSSSSQSSKTTSHTGTSSSSTKIAISTSTSEPISTGSGSAGTSKLAQHWNFYNETFNVASLFVIAIVSVLSVGFLLKRRAEDS